MIEKKIGAGGMGAVYLAVDNRFDNYVAIKETFYNDEEFGEAFEREAKLLNSLHHPGLPHVSDYFTENNIYFLVMQYIEGEDLSDILKREGSFPVETVMNWTKSLLDALGYLHSQSPPIIHRDIKPHNLKLTPRGDIMLLDFGLAKADYDETTGAVSVFGYSRTYSPLEQIQGTGTDERSDIFALSATVYHLLTGKPPIDALSRAAAIVNGKPDPIQLASELKPEIPLPFASIINSGLALNPENRFISVNAMRQAFEYAINEDSKNEIIANPAVPAVSAVPPAEIIKTAEAGNFPALEAFAAEVEKNPSSAAQSGDRQIIPVIPNAPLREIPPAADSPHSAIFAETPTEVSIRAKNNFKPRLWAILAAALVLGVAAALYLSGRESSAGQTDQTPVAETEPAVNSNKKSPKPGSESVAETKTKPATTEKTAEKHNSEGTKNNPETSDDPEGLSRKKDASSDDETNSNNSDDEAEPEVILPENERTNRKDTRRRAERPIPDEMTEEEFQRVLREEKQKRRERRNKPDDF
ncbi:MAG TPA: protein kinase [Pyrinomonadaceae bacterium]|nr:protein kinase [Pyrinomonadaceae bacterium]